MKSIKYNIRKILLLSGLSLTLISGCGKIKTPVSEETAIESLYEKYQDKTNLSELLPIENFIHYEFGVTIKDKESLTKEEYEALKYFFNIHNEVTFLKFENVDISNIDFEYLFKGTNLDSLEFDHCPGEVDFNNFKNTSSSVIGVRLNSTDVFNNDLSALNQLDSFEIVGANEVNHGDEIFYSEDDVNTIIKSISSNLRYLSLTYVDIANIKYEKDLQILRVSNRMLTELDMNLELNNVNALYVTSFSSVNINRTGNIDYLELNFGLLDDLNIINDNGTKTDLHLKYIVTTDAIKEENPSFEIKTMQGCVANDLDIGLEDLNSYKAK